jgi:tRNA nucleotidyltransferase (CCA-adding enzyme)
MKRYLVGGAVRDELLGLAIKDRDWVVVGSTPEDMGKLGYKPVGKDFPVFLHPNTKEEHALARKERKTGHGYGGFSFHTDANVTLEEDLIRRDLTINAMAKDENGITDPFNGQQDLEDGCLRHVSDAFIEDPLRVLRVARFKARLSPPLIERAFEIAPETLQLMSEITQSGELAHLSAERIWQECQLALNETAPDAFFDTLNQCGALDIVYDNKQNTFETSIQALKLACDLSKDDTVRFAAFLGVLNANAAIAVCKQLKVPKQVSEMVSICAEFKDIYADARNLPTPEQMTFLKRTDAFRKPERFLDILKAMQAVTQAIENSTAPHPQREYWIALYHAAAQIQVSDLTRVRMEGQEIAMELDKHRSAAMAKIKRTYRWSYFNAQV